jgi:hypothetical protein
MSWYTDSVWTEYPPGHIDAPQGAATGKDATFSSIRSGVHWLSLSGSANNGLVALAAGQPLFTHGRVENNGVTLYLSSAVAATGDSPASGVRLTQSAPLAGAFRLRAAENKKSR